MNGTGRLARIPGGRVTKWVVVVFWLVAVAVAGPLAGKLTDVQDNDAVTFLPSDAESTVVNQQAESFRDPNVAPALVIYEREGGITAADRELVAENAETFAGLPEVTGVSDPLASPDGQALQLVVDVDLGDEGNGWEDLPALVEQIKATDVPGDGLAVFVTGPAGVSADFADAFAGIDGRLFFAALGVVVVILLLSYRSPTLWLLPVISAVVALGVAQGVIYLLAEHADLTVNAQSQGILTVLVFGAGADYALLLVARYREELRRHADRHEAMGRALRRAGPAIFASGTTVMIGMLGLLFAQMNSTSGMGPVLAIGIAVGLAVMLTLLPALLVVLGRWVFWPIRPTYGSDEPTERGVWARIGRAIAPRPRAVWIVTTVVLGAMAVGITQLNADGLSNEDSFVGTPDSIVGQRVLTEHFPSVRGVPLVVISDSADAEDVTDELDQVAGVAPGSAEMLGDAAGRTYIEADLTDEPDGEAAQDTVQRVRAALDDVGDGTALVGGQSAILLDTQNASARDNKVVIPIVLAVVFVILALVLRAIVAPILLIATVVLSFAAALGLSSVVFTHLFGFAGADASLPLFAFVFLVALGIDYNIFLMTRVHEEARAVGTRRGALIGLAATGAVITSAGLVLAGTFSVLATLPVVAFAEIGFVIAVGVLLDTLVVRSVLVTALTLDVGRGMWWPSRLARTPDPVIAAGVDAAQRPAGELVGARAGAGDVAGNGAHGAERAGPDFNGHPNGGRPVGAGAGAGRQDRSMIMHQNLLAGPPATRLPDEAEPREMLTAGFSPARVAERHPENSVVWAALADAAFAEGRTIESYAYARTGYHRGLDALRRSGWRGHGPVPWEHAPNRGFLRCVHALGRAAAAIGEADEAERCLTFLAECTRSASDGLDVTHR